MNFLTRFYARILKRCGDIDEKEFNFTYLNISQKEQING